MWVSVIKNQRLLFQVLISTTVVVGGFYWWQGDKGLSLWDEGFLWYGAQRVMAGEVPIRDFMAYDPGRYYWAAGFMRLWDDNGIMALRRSMALFQMIGLSVGLWLIATADEKRHQPNFLYLLLSALILVLWMFPRHKLVDISMSIILIGVLTLLIRKYTGRYCFLTGLCIGLAVLFGRNHAVYGVAGSLGVMAWLNFRPGTGPGLFKSCLLWAAGVAVGFVPILLMALLVPDFGRAYWESIRFLFEIKATNLPLPVPWPWRISATSEPVGDVLRDVLVGMCFVGLPVFGVLSMGRVAWRGFRGKAVPSALVAATFLVLPYAHYAYSRADINHLAQGIFPVLIGCLVIISMQTAKVKWGAATILLGVSLWIMHDVHPGWQSFAGKNWKDIEVSGDLVQVKPVTAREIALLRRLKSEYAPGNLGFMVTPFWPGAYPLFESRSPTWEIYALYPRPETFQRQEIRRIEQARPRFVLIVDKTLNGRDDLRFRNTHPLIYRYIGEHFEPVRDDARACYQVFKARQERSGRHTSL